MKKNLAVMAHRGTPLDALDFFPTPPWATRALLEHVIGNRWKHCSVWEPACGAGHMSVVLREYFNRVHATDIHSYPLVDGAHLTRELDFLSAEALDYGSPGVMARPDWIITNPPFKSACDFTLRALEIARIGVAMLARTTWIESRDRYERLFRDRPLSIYAPFVERVCMVKGEWNPSKSTATSYAWFVWWRGKEESPVKLIPPGCCLPMAKGGLLHPLDHQRFARRVPAPLLEATHESAPRLHNH
jgi:hypothetical protein